MSKTYILDELAEIRGTISCFSHLFLLISGQAEPLDPKALGTISSFFDTLEKRIKTMEDMVKIQSVA